MVAVPLESFTVVMATGIVAVAARDDHHPAVALVLAVAACGGLVALLAWAAVARGMAGRAVAEGANPMERICGLFGFVAAADVVAAQFDPPTSGLVTACGVAALAAWVVLLPRLAGVVRASGLATLSASARGSWLLVAVATHSLALVAARLSAVGTAADALVLASVAWWAAGVLAYLVTIALVVRRLVRARLSPTLLTPDMWVLMGAVAIAVVAGGSTADALQRVQGFAGLAAVSDPALVGCWLVATAWIPLLVAAEARRARARRPGYEPARWATVFPLGMYAVACVTLASFTPAIRDVLLAVSGSMFWVALSAWCLTAAGLLARLNRLRHGRAT